MNQIKRWDQWFDSVGLSKEWAVVKEQFPDSVELQLRWAEILEMNRLTEVTKRKQEEVDAKSQQAIPTDN
jgi:hypothetical protein